MTTLRDRLSHLTYRQACKMLGPQGERFIRSGGKYEIDIGSQVQWQKNQFYLTIRNSHVQISRDLQKKNRIHIQCSSCNRACEHQGAALSLILENKMLLGLAAQPPEKRPAENLTDEELVQQAVEERRERSLKEPMHMTSMDKNTLWTDYVISNKFTGKSYRVALRGWERGESYCNCPDYRINTLGTCKHILYALDQVNRKFKKTVKNTPYQVKNVSVYARYAENIELRILEPAHCSSEIQDILRPIMGKPIHDIDDLLRQIRKIESLGENVTVYPDAEEMIGHLLYRRRVKHRVEDIRRDPKNHPLRKTLLKTELLPYQLDGIAFAVGAGRAIIADDMGLGKTVQGIGVAEMLSRDIHIEKVLVICPASLKAQWKMEIERFSNRAAQIIYGSAHEREQQYKNGCFFTLCNYEQVIRDIKSIEEVSWDLIILDEGQRIKNWEAKTTRVVKGLKSTFALVLSGTPLQNRLDELYTVVGFIDDRRLGPAFRFFNRHRVTDERGKVLGYKNLDVLRENLKSIMLRRTRKEVLDELPPRTTEVRRIAPTEEQLNFHNGQYRIISSIVSKKFLTEMDLLRLQKALLLCRMVANSTFLVDKIPPGYSTKLAEIEDLIRELTIEEDRKIILFSEWTTMLNLIEPILTRHQLKFVRLDGSVPQKKRQNLMNQFQEDPDCQLFITTNAGSTGLNLQAANTIINVDLPWNPAILEQRISRAHRMGQKRPVQVYLLITENTLEENLLGTLSSKHELTTAVLDPDADVTEVDFAVGMEELKRRLEILLGKAPEGAQDESQKARAVKEAQAMAQKENIANVGGQLFSAAFAFINEILPEDKDSGKTLQVAEAFKAKLSECMEKDEKGHMKLSLSFEDESALEQLSKSLARIANLR